MKLAFFIACALSTPLAVAQSASCDDLGLPLLGYKICGSVSLEDTESSAILTQSGSFYSLENKTGIDGYSAQLDISIRQTSSAWFDIKFDKRRPASAGEFEFKDAAIGSYSIAGAHFTNVATREQVQAMSEEKYSQFLFAPNAMVINGRDESIYRYSYDYDFYVPSAVTAGELTGMIFYGNNFKFDVVNVPFLSNLGTVENQRFRGTYSFEGPLTLFDDDGIIISPELGYFQFGTQYFILGVHGDVSGSVGFASISILGLGIECIENCPRNFFIEIISNSPPIPEPSKTALLATGLMLTLSIARIKKGRNL